MASAFDALMAKQNSKFTAVFGDDCVYTPQGAGARTIKFTLDAGIDEESGTGTADIDYDEHSFWISAVNDVIGVITPKVIARKAQGGDSLTFDGKTWFVVHILETKGGMHHLVCRDQHIPWQME